MTNATKENILCTASMYREYHDNYPCDLSLGKTAMRSMAAVPHKQLEHIITYDVVILVRP